LEGLNPIHPIFPSFLVWQNPAATAFPPLGFRMALGAVLKPSLRSENIICFCDINSVFLDSYQVSVPVLCLCAYYLCSWYLCSQSAIVMVSFSIPTTISTILEFCLLSVLWHILRSLCSCRILEHFYVYTINK